MVASQREKQIAVVVVTLLLGWGLYAIANAEYFGPIDDLSKQEADLTQQVQDTEQLFQQQKVLTKLWDTMQTQGLKSDASIADTQLYEALEAWASGAGLDTAPDLRRDPDRKAGDKSAFIVISYRVTADGSMKSISKLIWALETATIPVRVDNVTISPEPEGTDHLQAHLEVSTLCMAEPIGGPTATQPAPQVAKPAPAPTPVTNPPATQPAAALSTTNPTGGAK